MHSLIELMLKGFLLGIITAFSFGPVFFTIIETSITRGHRLAISIATGVLLSDVLIIAASFLSIGSLMQNETVSNVVGTIGGGMLVIFGIYHLLKPVAKPKTIEIMKPSHFSYFLFVTKGLMINTLNPFVFIYWLSAVSIVSIDQEYSTADKAFFFTSALLCNFFFDMVKTFLANRFKHLMTPRTMNFISKAVGCGIIYFGLRLLWKTLLS